MAVVALVALVVGGTLTILRTSWGSDLARRIALPRVNAAIAGRLELGRFAFGGDHVTLYDVVLRGPEGEVVLRVQEIALAFSPLSLLRRHVAISEARIVAPAVSLRREGDTLNLMRAIAPKEPPSSPPARSARPSTSTGGLTVDIADLRVTDGEMKVRSGPDDAAGTAHADFRATEIAMQGSAHFEAGPNAFAVTLATSAALRAPLAAPFASARDRPRPWR